MRYTVQRQVVFDALQKMNTHPTVDEIYLEVHRQHPTISKATVYRNLHQLAKNHQIRQLLLPGEMERYDMTTGPHDHFKCTRCQDLFDVSIDYHEAIDEAVQRKYGFTVDGHDVMFRGVCPKCTGTAPARREDNGFDATRAFYAEGTANT